MSKKKIVLAVLAVAFLGIQVVRPDRTPPPVAPDRAIYAQAELPAEVSGILNRACRDCHSVETEWPWYVQVAPVSWWMADHVRHGREHVNLSDWAGYDRDQQRNKLTQMCDQVTLEEMPLKSYLLMHGDAKLSKGDVRTLCEWTKAEKQKLASVE